MTQLHDFINPFMSGEEHHKNLRAGTRATGAFDPRWGVLAIGELTSAKIWSENKQLSVLFPPTFFGLTALIFSRDTTVYLPE